MAMFQGGNVQLVKPGDELCFDRPVKINEHCNNISDACKSCSNHPSNGGSGICLCTLGTPQVKC